jgi:hypothetical protein
MSCRDANVSGVYFILYIFFNMFSLGGKKNPILSIYYEPHTALGTRADIQKAPARGILCHSKGTGSTGRRAASAGYRRG